MKIIRPMIEFVRFSANDIISTSGHAGHRIGYSSDSENIRFYYNTFGSELLQANLKTNPLMSIEKETFYQVAFRSDDVDLTINTGIGYDDNKPYAWFNKRLGFWGTDDKPYSYYISENIAVPTGDD